MLCFRVDMGGDGSLVEDSIADGRRECDFDAIMGVARRARVGRGRLLNVLLRGMPPMGSSGRQM